MNTDLGGRTTLTREMVQAAKLIRPPTEATPTTAAALGFDPNDLRAGAEVRSTGGRSDRDR